MPGGIRWILVVLSLSAFLVPPVSAWMSYDIIASAGGHVFSLHRSTMYMNFSVDGSVEGSGNFSRWSDIKKFAGIEAMETTSCTKPSDLSYDERIRLMSREGPLVVVVHLESIDLTNETHPVVILEESGYLQVDEAWPTGYADYKNISYSGPGIKTMERYVNNGDVIATSIDSQKLTKESLYRGVTNRSIWFVNLAKNGPFVNRASNKTSYYALEMSSNGSLTSLDVINRDEPGKEVKSQVSQDFVGQQTMRLRINMEETIIYNREDDNWLDCCSGGFLNISA